MIGHYVNYRKQVSPSMEDLLPATDFRLFAVSVRFPAALAKHVQLTPVGQGVYDVAHYTGTIRLVVVHQLPLTENNAMLHLFSAQREPVRYGAEHYRLRSEETSTLLLDLFKRYQLEGTMMADMLEQFAREKIAEILKELPAEERLKGLSPAERLKGLTQDEVLAALPPDLREALCARTEEPESFLKPWINGRLGWTWCGTPWTGADLPKECSMAIAKITRPVASVLGLALLVVAAGLLTAEPSDTPPQRPLNVKPRPIAEDKSVKYDYDIVYVRAPRFVKTRTTTARTARQRCGRRSAIPTT